MSVGADRPQLRIVEEYWRQLSAVDPALYRRAGRSIRRRRMARTLAIALMVLLGLVGVAVAAREYLFGATVEPTYPLFAPQAPSARLQEQLLSVRVPDPQSGPEWGLRIFRPEKGELECVQVGRVVDGQLVALGINGALGDDGLAHPLPVEAQGCVGRNPDGHLRGAVDVEIRDSSAVLSPPPCLDGMTRFDNEQSLIANRRQVEKLRKNGSDAELRQALSALSAAQERITSAPPACDPAVLRTIFVGFVGPNGGIVTLTESSGATHELTAAPSDSGAYLFVLNGQPDRGSIRLGVRYPDGASCVIDNPWWNSSQMRENLATPSKQQACNRSAGYRPQG